MGQQAENEMRAARKEEKVQTDEKDKHLPSRKLYSGYPMR